MSSRWLAFSIWKPYLPADGCCSSRERLHSGGLKQFRGNWKSISGLKIYDGSGNEVEGCLVPIDNNNIEIHFDVLFSGSAHLI